eukprot:CAMPEP_0205814452 /NCGR_PEP_ID=MMETSP0205-20121125/19615_1 /ASSEMBLY_ACC=CAM_ASM_000278 /TAXON_ID=36767 /ORGANISM="Euplotes focardii, Strain TN1" /LENGTH=53 /DNA_ID=CAMNT_0053098563 /DNA_START=368 /DNA_END=529 /DNA_ORIENTATION=-
MNKLLDNENDIFRKKKEQILLRKEQILLKKEQIMKKKDVLIETAKKTFKRKED